MALKLNRDQLYALAAKASFGEDVSLVINPDSFDDDDKSFTYAIDVRESAPDNYLDVCRDNGWAYFRMDARGHVRVMSEEDE